MAVHISCGNKPLSIPTNGCDDCSALEERVENLEQCCEDVHTELDGKADKTETEDALSRIESQLNSLVAGWHYINDIASSDDLPTTFEAGEVYYSIADNGFYVSLQERPNGGGTIADWGFISSEPDTKYDLTLEQAEGALVGTAIVDESTVGTDGGAGISLVGSDNTVDTIHFEGGSNVTITGSDNTITFNAASGDFPICDLGVITPDENGIFPITAQQSQDILDMWNDGYCGVAVTYDDRRLYALKLDVGQLQGEDIYAFVGAEAHASMAMFVLGVWTGTTVIGINPSQNIGLFMLHPDLNEDDVYNIVDGISPRIRSISVNISVADWNGGTTCTKSIPFTGEPDSIIVAPAPASITEWASTGVYCSSQTTTTATFACSVTPTSDITANILGIIERGL